jgi:hypothetical protein
LPEFEHLVLPEPIQFSSGLLPVFFSVLVIFLFFFDFIPDFRRKNSFHLRHLLPPFPLFRMTPVA